MAKKSGLLENWKDEKTLTGQKKWAFGHFQKGKVATDGFLKFQKNRNFGQKRAKNGRFWGVFRGFWSIFLKSKILWPNGHFFFTF